MAKEMARDFTYIDDIVDGIIGSLDHVPQKGEHRVLNIGDSHPVGLMDMIETLEKAIGRKAERSCGRSRATSPQLMPSQQAQRDLRLQAEGDAGRRARPLRRLVQRGITAGTERCSCRQ